MGILPGVWSISIVYFRSETLEEVHSIKYTLHTKESYNERMTEVYRATRP